MSNGLDLDQDPKNVSSDLDPNCLQRLSADLMTKAFSRKKR